MKILFEVIITILALTFRLVWNILGFLWCLGASFVLVAYMIICHNLDEKPPK